MSTRPPKKEQVVRAQPKITLAILENNKHLLQGLCFELDLPDLEICCASDNLEEFLSGVETCKPQISIIDLRIYADENDTSGLIAVKQVHESSPNTKCIVYTSYDSIQNFSNTLDLGINAFVSKELNEIPIERVIHIVAEGGTYYGRFLPQWFNKVKDLTPGLNIPNLAQELDQSVLTKREKEILEILAQNPSLEYVVDRLVISLNTVKAHLGRIRKKLGVKTTSDAVRMAKVRNMI